MYSNVWIQVDFKKTMTLHGVATQGSSTNVKEWMTSYQVMYANESEENFTAVMDISGINPKVSTLFDLLTKLLSDKNYDLLCHLLLKSIFARKNIIYTVINFY